jgi:hypothetical protein
MCVCVGGGAAQTTAHGQAGGIGRWQQWPKAVSYPMRLGTGQCSCASGGRGGGAGSEYCCQPEGLPPGEQTCLNKACSRVDGTKSVNRL